MIYHIISFIILLISIDIYSFLYKKYKMLFLKRQNSIERQYGIEEDKLSKYEDVSSKLPIIIYSIAAIIGGIYFNFINQSIFENNSNFFSILFTNFEIVFFVLFVFLSVSIFIKYIKDIILFFIGFKNALIKNKKKENNNLDEIDEEENND